jgi:subtilisin family serine protease
MTPPAHHRLSAPRSLLLLAWLAVPALGAAPGCQSRNGADPPGDHAGLAASRSPLIVSPPRMPGAPPPAATGPARLIVKLRPGLDQTLVQALRPATGTIDLGAVKTGAPAFSALLESLRLRRATPLFASRLRDRLRTGLTDAQVAAALRRRFPARSARVAANSAPPNLGGGYVFELDDRSRPALEQAMAALRADPAVLEVEEDKVVHTSYVPNDPSYATAGSWGQSYDDLYGLKKIGTTAAWNTARGTGVIVAVVDSGVDRAHPDIDANIWTNPGELPSNGLDDDGNGLIDDTHGWDFVGPYYGSPQPDSDPSDVLGHGTHVAGTIAAEGDNALGVVGVAWKSKIMVVRALDDGGYGLDSTLANAILYAVNEGADVINASWGGPGASSAVRDAVEYAHAHGVVFVAAAGNSNQDALGFYPASFSSAITVAASDPFDQKAYFSNFGNKIDVAAPGVDILSLEKNTGGYVRLQGTSMAAPHVSGAAALILELHPTFTVEQVRQALRGSAFDAGAAGKDPEFGYGRLSAAGAVLLNQVPGAKILSPADGTIVQGGGAVPLVGTAQGGTFVHYVVEVGSGASPTTFTTIVDSTTAVAEGQLATFDPSTRPDGLYTVRLRVIDGAGKTWSDQIQIQVRYLALLSPASGTVPALTLQVKPGSTVDIVGRAVGPSFQRYTLEWAAGRDATTGFSATGMTLVGGGLVPVDGAVLGQFATPAGQAGEKTVRLTVTNASFSSTVTATLHLEPDLVSSGWPRFVDHDGTTYSVVPARQADGQTRFLVCGFMSLPNNNCHSFAIDGSSTVTPIQKGSYYPPSAGNLDGLPGDEVVVADFKSLRIFSADLSTTVRTIVGPGGEFFGIDPTLLADLDGDGTPEVITAVHNDGGGFPTQSGSLQVYRANGQLFSPNYPVVLSSPTTPGVFQGAVPVAADIDGDGTKEILVAVLDTTSTQYAVLAFNADGTPHASWAVTSFPTSGFYPALAADLDRDGRAEVVIGEYLSNGTASVRVLDSTGVTRPGWPVAVSGNAMAIGDLDRDGRDEIVAEGPQSVRVIRHDGTPFGAGQWPLEGTGSYPAIADVDGDGAPDVVVCDNGVGFAGNVPYYDARLRVFNNQGLVTKTWQLYGMNGQQGTCGGAALGDFNGDGKTDVVAKMSLVTGGGTDGANRDGALSLLTTGAAFDPANADWPMDFHDPQNSRHRVAAPLPPTTTVHLSAAADAHVRDGSSAAVNFGTATTLDSKNSTTAGNNRRTFLRFSLATVGGAVTSAKLRLAGNSVTSAKYVGVYAVSNITWGETTITFNNAPAIGAKQGGSISVGLAPAQYYEWDVTSYVQAQKSAGAASFELKQDAATGEGPTAFSSREAASNQPELVVTSGPPPVDEPPVVAAGPSASPNPVTATTASLSVLGADDNGEAALTYTWSTTGAPPAPVSFSANGTNAGKNSTATFTAPGAYDLQVSIKDAANQTVTAPLQVTVSPTLTTITVTPATASVATSGTQQFSASGKDQFGATLTSQPTFAWTVSGGGTISTSGLFTAGATGGGPFTVTAASGGKSGTAQVTVTGGGGTVTLNPVADAHVRDGSSAATNFGTVTPLETKNTTSAGTVRRLFLRFAIDGFGSGVTLAKLRLNGNSVTSAKLIGVYAISNTTWSETTITYNNAPAIGAKQGASQSVGLTAAYVEWDVTSYVQAQKTAGATAVSFEVKQDVATTESPSVFSSREAASNKPQLVVTTGGGGTDTPPTVATAAAAAPNPATGTTTALSVLGADDNGEAALTYTWSTTGTPPAAVTFSANGTNGAKNTTATFTKAGSYAFQVVIRDAASQTVTSPVSMTVSQTLTSVVVTPATASVATGGTQSFTATARDQFATALTSQPTFAWTVSGGGTINSAGLFTAGATAGGPFTVTAASGGYSGTAQVTVTGGGGTVTLNPAADAHVRDGTNAAVNFGTTTTLEQKNSSAAGNVRRTFLRFSLSGVGSTVTQAKLRLYGASVTSAKLVGVYAVSNITWSETTITYNNAPAIGAKQGSSQNVGLTAAYVEWDLASYVQAQKTAGATAVSFEVKQDVTNNDTPTTFNARENASSKPQLVVTSN